MKRIVLAAGAAALALGTGAAYAQQRMEGDVTLSQMQTKSAEKFAKMDVNGDGVLDTADRAARQTAMFDRMDTDNDGSISRGEFDAMHAKRGEMRGGMHGEKGGEGHMGKRGHRGGGMMQMTDADNDGTITRAEFDAGVTAMFAKADANKDGTITDAERKAAHDAMRSQWRQNRNND